MIGAASVFLRFGFGYLTNKRSKNGSATGTRGKNMARTPDQDYSNQTGAHGGNPEMPAEIIQAASHDTIDIPGGDFIGNADILKEGADLILKGDNGETIIIEGYFDAHPAPILMAPDGGTLTPGLVQAFVRNAGPVHYAQNGTMTDVSPVGAVEEVSGDSHGRHDRDPDDWHAHLSRRHY